MSKLPGPEDLGQVNPGSGERPIGEIDAQPIARGAERLGAGIAQAGQGLDEIAQHKATYDYAMGHAGFLSDLIGLNETTARDLNYGRDENGQDLTQRYATQAGALSTKWAARIGPGPMQQIFSQRADEAIARGQSAADTHAFKLYGDHQMAATDTLGEDLGNKAVSSADPTVHADTMDAYGASVDALANRGFITQDQAVAKKRAFGANVASGLLIQQAQTDPLGAINHIRAKPGSDAELTERYIQVESGGDPNAASSTSSSAGLGGYTKATWLSFIHDKHPELAQGRSDDDILALRADPGLTREAIGSGIAQNRASFNAQGIAPSAGNLYLAHFLGPGDAAKVLKAPPGTPVADLLDPKVIAANQLTLAGKTAGTVAQWSADKMGGYAPGDGSIYSYIQPQQRAALEAKLGGMLHQKVASDLSDFKQRYEDTIAEARNTGSATTPLAQEDFIRTYGAERGARAYQDYQGELQLGADVQRVANMKPEEQQQLYGSYEPQPGTPDYAKAVKRQAVLGTAIKASNDERDRDPGAFAVHYLPAARDAWGKLTAALSDPQVGDDDRRSAARDFANKTIMEQQRVGVSPEAQSVVPKSYADGINGQLSTAANSEEPQARVGLIAKVQQEAALWGDAWPQVMRQIAPGAQPLVRAIAAGADPQAMTRLLSLGKDEKPAELLKQQSETKAGDLTKAVDTAMAPFLATMVGRQRDRDFTGYYNLATTLGALYVRDGMSATDAASKAFNDLVGNRYDFRDTYRIPKTSGVSADDVQAGAQAARGKLGDFNVAPAVDDIGLGENNRTDSLTKFGRDGKWVTAPGNDGLNLVYGDKSVRVANGTPLKLTWAELAQIGHQRAAANAADASVVPGP